jgi:hypothetical protein
VSLSGRWAGDSHAALGAATTDIQRLALALGPVRSVIRVIDEHVPPLAVDWAMVGKDAKGRLLSQSYTDFAGGRIAISPLPVMEFGSVNPSKAIDITTGFAIHEAGHGQHSRDRFEALTKTEHRELHPDREVAAFRPMRVAAYVWNLVEDVRSERATTDDWPGFRPYLGAVLDWVWADINERGDIPTTYGLTVADKLKVAFIACRYPDKAHLMTRKMSVKAPSVDPAEVAWWQDWQADYLRGKTGVKQTIDDALAHLGSDPETQTEMDKMTQAEEREIESGERIRAQIDRLIREGVKGAFAICITQEGDARPLTEDEADSVDQLIREGFMVIDTVDAPDGASCAEIRVSKPEETGQSRAAYIGRPDATVEALRAALVLRQSLPRHDIKLQKSGEVDDEELYRLSTGDYRVFTERVIEGRPDTAIGLLVDLSGSMAWGSKLGTAQRLAQVMLWALHDQPGIETRVWGHTGDHGVNGSDIYRLWEPGDPLSRLGLIDTLDHNNNYDGWAIGYCVSQMVDLPQPQRVLIVLSDGLPSGRTYGGDPAQHHVRQTVESARRNNVHVLQIAIDEDLRMEDQVAMFGEDGVIGYESEAALPRQLTKVLSRWA